MPSRSLHTIVLRHFDLYQRESDATRIGKQTKRRRSKPYSVNGRVAMIRDDLGTLKNPLSSEMVKTVLYCLDAAIATEVTQDTQDSVDRVLELVVALGLSGPITARALVERIIGFATTASLERVRAQACHMLGMCAEHFFQQTVEREEDVVIVMKFLQDQDESWREDCFRLAKNTLLHRLTDKIQSVRLAAIVASKHLFLAPLEDTNDEFVASLTWTMAHDPSAANREAAVKSFPLSVKTIDHVIERTRDVKEKVRVASYDTLVKFPLENLSEDQCAVIIRAGLTDRCPATKQAATRMICSGWMKSAKYDPVALTKHLDPIVNDVECERVLTALLQANDNGLDGLLSDLSGPEKRAFHSGISQMPQLFGDVELTPEAVFFARAKCEIDQKSTARSAAEKAEMLSGAVPDVPMLCEVIGRHLEHLTAMILDREGDDDGTANSDEETEIVICIQLLKVAQMTDLKEEGSRRYLRTEMKSMLSSMNTPDDLLEEALKALIASYDRESNLLVVVSEIVQSIEETAETVGDMGQLRIVAILTLLFENTSARVTAHPAIQELVKYVIPAITSSSSILREAGVGCLGRLALLAEMDTLMAEFKPLLLKVAANEDEKVEIRAQAMLALSDLAMIHSSILSPCVSKDERDSFSELVMTMLSYANVAVVAVAAEVAAKLLLSGRMRGKHLLAKLLVVFFDKNLADAAISDDGNEVGSPARMQQMLSLFFPSFGMKSRETKVMLVEAIGPMLLMVTSKPKKRGRGVKATTWPLATMIEFVYSTADVSEEEENEEGEQSEQETLEREPTCALLVCLEIASFLLENSDNLSKTHLRTLAKLLGGADVDVETDNPEGLTKLRELVDELMEMIIDDNALECLETMHEVLHDDCCCEE